MDVAQLLNEAARLLQQNISRVDDSGRVSGVPVQMQGVERGIIEALKAVENHAGGTATGTHAWRAREIMDGLTNHQANPVRHLVMQHGAAPNGHGAAYRTDMGTVLNYVQQALQHVSNAQNPQGREAWTLTDWQEKDSEGLARMVANKTPVFMKLFQQHYGREWSEGAGREPARR